MRIVVAYQTRHRRTFRNFILENRRRTIRAHYIPRSTRPVQLRNIVLDRKTRRTLVPVVRRMTFRVNDATFVNDTTYGFTAYAKRKFKKEAPSEQCSRRFCKYRKPIKVRNAVNKKNLLSNTGAYLDGRYRG